MSMTSTLPLDKHGRLRSSPKNVDGATLREALGDPSSSSLPMDPDWYAVKVDLVRLARAMEEDSER